MSPRLTANFQWPKKYHRPPKSESGGFDIKSLAELRPDVSLREGRESGVQKTQAVCDPGPRYMVGTSAGKIARDSISVTHFSVLISVSAIPAPLLISYLKIKPDTAKITSKTACVARIYKSEAVGARTRDLRIKSPLLYQLSYSL